MKTVLFEIDDVHYPTFKRYGYCQLSGKFLSVAQLEIIAKKYETDFEIMWVHNFKNKTSIPHAFVMKLEDHMYNAYIIAET